MSPSIKPNGFVAETLRVLIILFGGAVGYQIADSLDVDPNEEILGLLTAPMLGVIIGAGLGYSLGGVFARRLVSAFERGDSALAGITPEELVSGSIGAVIGAILAAVLCWPVFLIATPLIAVSIFGFAVIVTAAFGFTIAQRRRESVLDVVGRRAGVASVTRSSSLPRLIDTSVAIDGRFTDVVAAGFGLGRIVVCQPVLDELQNLADAQDPRRRQKGRRGLETLDRLRRQPGIDLTVIPDEAPEVAEVDAKLIRIALAHSFALLTLDTGLAKVAAVSGVEVQNLHALSLSLRPPVAVGDPVTVRLIREGKESGQAVGYLDDGTMLVVEQARQRIGDEVDVEVTSVLTTSNGRMAFARLRSAA